MSIKRTIRESPIIQGTSESITYTLTTTPWGTSPTAVSIIIYDITDTTDEVDWTDVTATVMPDNSPSVVGDVITFSPLESLVDGHIYRAEINFTIAMGDVETSCLIYGGR
jgi:hypothetical protein